MLAYDIAHYANLFGPSGSEGDVRERLRTVCHEFTEHVKEDNAGNLYAMLPATDRSTRRTPVVLSAHMDEIGFIVQSVEDGIARLRPVGTWRADILLGQSVAIRTQARSVVFGHVGMMPVHWSSRPDKRGVTFDDLWVDYTWSAEDLTVGDFGVVDRPTCVQGYRVIGKALDNRAGVTAVANAMRCLSARERPRPIIAIFTAHEETSGFGAQRASHAVREMFHSVAWPITNPAKCCVVDATFATDDGSRVDEKSCRKYGPVALGNGPVVCPTANTSAAALAWLRQSVAQHAARHQVAPYASQTDTDADTFGMVPWLDAALLSYPLRNMHSPVEIVDSRDLAAVTDVLVGLCAS